MIVCPNCNHPNPDGAVQCEACYTPLPATTICPNCGATVQADASFCGQCGYHLRAHVANVAATIAPDIPQETAVSLPPEIAPVQPIPVPAAAEPAPMPPTMVSTPGAVEVSTEASLPPIAAAPVTIPPAPAPEPAPETAPEPAPVAPEPAPVVAEAPAPEPAPEPVPEPAPEPAPEPVPVVPSSTRLQQITARLVHVQTDRQIELPQNLSVVHIGKPNDRIPPDVDVSGFPSSEIVSRIHADIRIEGDAHYIEDVGSSNGTYINNLPLLPGNRHRLRTGDRISLGKGDMVTFLFQIS
ncbi:FHA domain-containing protein [Calothrix sp. 336/3]|uniref:FHA domain-containing protein n=1 Tax=Calothrix sp. 336/3 TaxID=1337936 RepID=UPI0004E3A3E8|nr:FHA domain-containing protein [Calothrix sp. 336/3]AKG20213.1 peptide-binding protein [Calothrix sp. 336/3]